MSTHRIRLLSRFIPHDWHIWLIVLLLAPPVVTQALREDEKRADEEMVRVRREQAREFVREREAKEAERNRLMQEEAARRWEEAQRQLDEKRQRLRAAQANRHMPPSRPARVR